MARRHGPWCLAVGEDVAFTTAATSVEGATLHRDRYACLCVDDRRPLLSFVMVEGPVELSSGLDELRGVATWIGRRYMGHERAKEFGGRNAVEVSCSSGFGQRTCCEAELTE
jgi:hypothetical protein